MNNLSDISVGRPLTHAERLKMIWFFIRDNDPKLFKKWVNDAEKFRDGKIKKYLEGKQVFYFDSDTYQPLEDADLMSGNELKI